MKIRAVGLTGEVAHYVRYFCIDRCRFYFSSCTCTCVAVCQVRYLRQCSSVNPADIHVLHDFTRLKKNPILYFMPILTLLFVRLCVYYTRSTYAHRASRQTLENSMNNHVILKGVDVEVMKVIQLASEVHN